MAAEEGGKDEHHQEGLPGVAGAVQATLNSKPIAALLTPAAEVFGDYFKQRAAAKVAEWEEKRRANVREHRRRAEYLSGQELPGDATEFQARLALEWADHVQNVDPVKDEDLSALWESLFAKIAANDRSARRYVDIIKQLEPEDAAALLSPLPYRFTRDTEMRSSDRLISAGLLARSRTFVPNFQITLLALILAVAIWLAWQNFVTAYRSDTSSYQGDKVGQALVASWNYLAHILQSYNLEIFSLILLAVSIFVASTMYARWKFGLFRLTSIGQEIRTQGLLYRVGKANWDGQSTEPPH